jgi:hypothetical protein
MGVAVLVNEYNQVVCWLAVHSTSPEHIARPIMDVLRRAREQVWANGNMPVGVVCKPARAFSNACHGLMLHNAHDSPCTSFMHATNAHLADVHHVVVMPCNRE